MCVDVIDLGMMKTDFQGQERIVPKVKVIFESEQQTDDGQHCTVSKNFTASLHPKAKLADFLGKWRGRPVVPGESIDLSKLIGACCTLVISHQQNMVGRTYASIDAVSKPTKKLKASGGYDPVATRQRIAEWQAGPAAAPRGTSVPATAAGSRAIPQPSEGGGSRPPKSGAPVVAAAPEFDPEIGF